ncbi:MAG TPA: hypothetical protein VFX61_05695 [Micromonosporaceae bacterium]|nr:hypothetical protein [Micromonosporaceae bacterium]
MIAPSDRTPLPGEFFDRPVPEVAPDQRGRPGHVCVYFTYRMSSRSA